ncbi:hypothetical protein [Ammonifex thiophilus]|uniref:Uncharacterized protein n=1 Tax=Ammonifex thiophilus TaxID=444093 RepID=A0A3D8P3L3_9THEO|nr:hypothetical protein [Ammonifex thiophilus]RDV81226.1 hypothetical protein DXX99_09590 [Ammonifex thiophilus]
MPKRKKAEEDKGLFGLICPVEDLREVTFMAGDGREVTYGVIVLPGRRARAVARVKGISYHLLSPEEQGIKAEVLRSAVLSLNFPVQFYTYAEVVDLREVAARLAQRAENLRGGPAEYALAMMDYYVYISRGSPLRVRRSYAVVGVDSPPKQLEQALHERVLLFLSVLGSAGVKAELLTPGEVLNLLHDALNPGRLFRPADALDQLDAVIDWRDRHALRQEKAKEPGGDHRGTLRERPVAALRA